MRFTLLCNVAIPLATTKVMAMMMTMMPSNCGIPPSKAPLNNRYIPKMAAPLTTVAIHPVMGVGAPWYTSGAQKWNGATEILNPNPVKIMAKPTHANGAMVPLCKASWMVNKSKLPVAPYNNAMPNNYIVTGKQIGRAHV